MNSNAITVSRPARVKFKNSVEAEGVLIYVEEERDKRETATPFFVFRLNDEVQTERSFEYWNVDIITFL